MDLQHSDSIMIMGSNMAECHPVAFRWPMKAKAKGAKLIHVDPRFTRTSAMANIYAPLRAGSDIVFLGALVSYIINSPRWNGVLWIVPVIPVATFGAWTLDTLITDPWAFWFGDVWDNAGTGFEHLPVEWPDGRMESLWRDRSGWLRHNR